MSAAKRRAKAIKRRQWVKELREDRCRWLGHEAMGDVFASDPISSRLFGSLSMCHRCGGF